MTKSLTKQVENELSEPVALTLNHATPDVWHKIIEFYKKAAENGQTTLERIAKSFNSSEEELGDSIKDHKLQSWIILRKKIDEELADTMLLLKLRSNFEEKFRYDEQGLPRVWKPQDDIDAHFKRAKDDTLKLIKLFSKIDLKEEEDLEIESTEDFDFDQSLTVLSEAKQIDISNRFKRECDAFYLEAKRSIVSTTAKIPSWAIAAMVFLGWNEFMAIIRNPIYLILFVLLITFGYVIFALNLWGPLERIITTVAGEATRIAKERIADSVEKAKELKHSTEKDKKE
ncbi:hypothetical protein G6F35_010146 [Rhizopus arrhizus]|nr:hypothetical protein G6F35_010146 [Rhizopus arrhizus]KAG1518697.1 hypothetical protein G6F53_000368 [Rhizopus delemar]KAG1562229.1 hypothetical protein G6F49_001106 [Rhizopus delemar]